MAPEIPWLPVIQGWTFGHYLDCIELYLKHGVDLFEERLVGIGSVCRRHNTLRAQLDIQMLAEDGLRIHAFGFKKLSLPELTYCLVSADSMAWSYHARRNGRNQNSLDEALRWHTELLTSIEGRGLTARNWGEAIAELAGRDAQVRHGRS